MALHRNFPKSPHEILDPSIRWFPADKALREKGYEKLLPPLVHTVRQKIQKWLNDNYGGEIEEAPTENYIFGNDTMKVIGVKV